MCLPGLEERVMISDSLLSPAINFPPVQLRASRKEESRSIQPSYFIPFIIFSPYYYYFILLSFLPVLCFHAIR